MCINIWFLVKFKRRKSYFDLVTYKYIYPPIKKIILSEEEKLI